MKGLCIFRFLTGAVTSSAIVLMVVVATPIPVLSAEDVSPVLRTMITSRIKVPSERYLVLRSTARATESGFPEDHLAPVIEKSLDAGVSGKGLSRMIDILSEAHVKGMPIRSYTWKIMEGLIKKVDEDLIIAALGRVDERMGFSAKLAMEVGVHSDGSDDLIIQTAGAIAAGMDKEVLRDVYIAMASEGINRNIEPEDIMEMVKAASGYGVDSEKVGAFAKSLIQDPDANLRDIRIFLKDLADRTFTDDSDEELDDILEEHMESVESEDDGEDDGEEDDGSAGDESEDAGSEEGETEEGESEEGESEESGSEEGESEESGSEEGSEEESEEEK